MERIQVISSNVAEVGYDESRAVLEIVFHSGPVYQYFDVPKIVFTELVNAESIGKYFNKKVKQNYRYARL